MARSHLGWVYRVNAATMLHTVTPLYPLLHYSTFTLTFHIYTILHSSYRTQKGYLSSRHVRYRKAVATQEYLDLI